MEGTVSPVPLAVVVAVGTVLLEQNPVVVEMTKILVLVAEVDAVDAVVADVAVVGLVRASKYDAVVVAVVLTKDLEFGVAVAAVMEVKKSVSWGFGLATRPLVPREGTDNRVKCPPEVAAAELDNYTSFVPAIEEFPGLF